MAAADAAVPAVDVIAAVPVVDGIVVAPVARASAAAALAIVRRFACRGPETSWMRRRRRQRPTRRRRPVGHAPASVEDVNAARASDVPNEKPIGPLPPATSRR